MNEDLDRKRLELYMKDYKLETIFNEELLPHLSLYSFNQGEFICTQGEPSSMMYILVKGKVKIFTTSAEGKALILSFMKPLEVIGDIEYLQGLDMINTVEAVSPVKMIGVHHRWLNKYGKDHAPLLQFLLDIVSKKIYMKSNFLSFNLMHPVEVRLASYLMSVSYDESDAIIKGEFSTLSLVDAANLIGTSYRHLNRVIRKFCQEGLLERKRGFIQIKDREGLSIKAEHNIYEQSL
ncbi:Crp/Fnr family transcriptional regulator [Paenibacillus dakarensis]|uniref:Crp/Fnr family transcriptional regulator n=1 Tax=Paenibacillus dakarensis TaxID=1527293 RepID=UPI0006D56F6F|nr:Crp/Fnr family transcriptional regulator [Paenibacillus dakarensis]